MKKIKDNIKFVFAFIIGSIITSTTTAVAVTSIMASDVNFTPRDSSWNVQNADAAINDLYYKMPGIPTGTVLPFMGTSAPAGYVVCDGTEYQISSHSNLAEFIKIQFGSYNYFGGDGTTTFKVPDLRGEFLRGSGTGERNTGTGASVGVHQDPTQHLNLTLNQGKYFGPNVIYGYGQTRARNVDKKAEAKTGSSTPDVTLSSGTDSNTEAAFYASRPTNTAVLYIIKY